LVSPQKGNISIKKIIFNSSEKINIPVQSRNIGYVFQEGRLFPHIPVKKNLLYGVKKNDANPLSFTEVVDQ
jgi:molybdate transport system ATP-binding protein